MFYLPIKTLFGNSNHLQQAPVTVKPQNKKQNNSHKMQQMRENIYQDEFGRMQLKYMQAIKFKTTFPCTTNVLQNNKCYVDKFF